MSLLRVATSLVAVAVLAVLPVVPAAAQETMKMNISISQNSHYGVAVDAFAREIEKRSNGRYKVQNFYSGALGAERESIEAVQLGTLDLTMTSTGPVPNFVPEVAILDIPFLFKDYPHARATRRVQVCHCPNCRKRTPNERAPYWATEVWSNI